jgi:hypothetical protein
MSEPINFADLQLSAPVLKALKEVGYEVPSPIQAQTIPLLMDNQDVLGLVHRYPPARAAGAGAGADARTGDPGGGGFPEVRQPHQ